MVDCSGSMDYPPTKMRGARDATAAAIDALRDGVHFAVIGGTHVAKEVYPGGGRLAVADAQTRDQAKQALRKLSAGGGTAIGTWLRLADRLLSSADVAIRHGILLTDGRNEHESPEDLKAAAGRLRRAVSPVTRGASAPTGRSRRSPGSPPRCSAPPTSSPTRRACPPTSRR